MHPSDLKFSLTLLLNFTIIIPYMKTYAMGHDVKGWCAPVFTPCDENRNLRVEIIPTYAEFLYMHGVDCIVVAGTTGEHSTLTLLERKILLDAWIIVGKPLDFKIISQVGGAPYPDVIEMAKYSESVQADVILSLPESFYKPTTPEQLVEFMQELSEAAPSTPLIYYDLPLITGVNVNMVKFFDLATQKIPNFKGIKTSLQTALDMQIQNKFKPDQTLFIAGQAIASDVLLGFDSIISTAINVFPDLVQTIKRYGNESNTINALKTQADLYKFINIIISQGELVSAWKAAMEVITGIKVGPTRKPLPLVTEQQKLVMAIKLQELGVRVSSEYSF